ncbi:MAG: ABC transporter substrate-binding protein [Gammaproteobacteria bacterium]|nr:ABC transporter substrate-binding protein [Gammaproteobacteria bacterium]
MSERLRRLAIGGVPEHFNLPWRRVLGSGRLAAAGIDASWQDFPGGSGAMGAALNEGELDVAMLLTEGAVAGIANGGTYRIVSRFTETPLIWGIHVPAASNLHSVADLQGSRYAISRHGSGSHLMAFAHARHVGWPVGELDFVVVGGLDGAVEAFDNGGAEVFLWEKFMTQPLVDEGRFRRVGEFSAPWPAFVVCVSGDALRQKAADVATALEHVLAEAARFAASPSAADDIARDYGLRREHAAEWLRVTRWASTANVDDGAVSDCIEVLRAVGLVESAGSAQMLARI